MSPRLAAPILAVSLVVGAGVPLAVAWSRPSPNAGYLTFDLPEAGLRADGSRQSTGVPRATVATRSARLADRRVRSTSDRPTQLVIPSLGVAADVVPVGVEADGQQVAIPTDVGTVGWYRFGPAPGDPGSTLLVGHVDAHDQGPGALFGLRRLEPGARVVVRRWGGGQVRYRVIARRSYPKGQLPPLLFARHGSPVLAMVTCGGAFDPESRHYADNVVVFAVPLAR